MNDQDIRRQLVELSASLFQRGYSVGSAGNISVRVDGGWLLTPTNSSLGRLDPERLSLVDEDWRHIAGDPPTKEVPMHRAVYEGRPQTRALVHLHSTYVTALSTLWVPGEPFLPPLTPYNVMKLGTHIPVIRYFRPGSSEVVEEIREAAREAKAIVLAHHGSLVADSSLVEAVNAAEEMEVSAQLTLMTAGRNPRTLTKEQVAELL